MRDFAGVTLPSANAGGTGWFAPTGAPRAPLPGLRDLWLVGVGVVGVWFAFAHVAAWRLIRRCRPAPLVWRVECAALAKQLGIRQRVAIRFMPDGGTPLTAGLFTASILLPATALEWPRERRRSVLVHELAHVSRHDCRAQVMAHVACAMYWFNPLTWVANAAMRRERERACDQAVIASGTAPSEYAAHLLEIARALHPRLISVSSVAMARPRELEGRLMAILSTRAWTFASLTRRRSISAVLAALAGLILIVSPAESTSRPAGERMAMVAEISASAEQARQVPSPAAPPEQPSHAAAAPAPSGSDPTVATLTAALQDASADVREKAAMRLALLSTPDVIPPLVDALKHRDPQVREKAALGLSMRRDARILAPLIQATRDPDRQVRDKAIIALGTAGDAQARPALEAATRDPDPQIREKAFPALILLESVTDPQAQGDRIRSGLRTLLGSVLRLAR